MQSVDDLEEFVRRCGIGGRFDKLAKKAMPVLLVDGYDEISTADRHRVSEALTEFQSLKKGCFYLTCRSFYDVYDLRANRFEIERFTNEHQINFIRAFSEIYEIPIHAENLVSQLNSRGLKDLAAHPLTLTLICMLKSGVLPDLPDNTLALLKRAFDLLTLRWDQQKGVSREAQVALDGEERIRCLMRVAYKMMELRASQEEVEGFVREYLRLSQHETADAREVLLDTARWYGVLVPTEVDEWEFVHRSIHDYLAARFWVESGSFRPASVRSWTTRVAYAACLSPNATETLVRALRECEGLDVVAECLRNKPSFDPNDVASAFFYHFSRFVRTYAYDRGDTSLSVSSGDDIFTLFSDQLLLSLLRHATLKSSLDDSRRAAEFVCAYVLRQVLLRKRRVIDDILCCLLSVCDKITVPFKNVSNVHLRGWLTSNRSKLVSDA